MRAALFAVLLALAIAVPVFGQSQPTQSCTFSENEYYSYDDVAQCFYSIRLNDTIKLQTLDTMRKGLEVYAFLDIAHNSPDPNLPVKINMFEALQDIEERPYTYDMDFQSDLRAVFDQLNDAHTQYYLPTCYQNILIRQPLSPIGYGDSVQDFSIVVSPYFDEDMLSYYASIGVDPTQYVGAEILQVNGIPAFDYFLQYANNSVGMSKDISTRFNFALTVPEPRDDIQLIQWSYWQQRTHRNPFPKQPSVFYVLKLATGQEVQVEFPWTFQALKTYSGVSSFLDDYHSVPQPGHVLDEQLRQHLEETVEGVSTKAARPQSFMNIPENGRARDIIRERKKQLLAEHFPHMPNAEEEMSFELLVNTTHLTFWALNDNQTLVIFLDSMEPNADGISGYYRGLKDGFDIAAERGLTRLIIDLTNNGGGNICVGRTLLTILQQDGWKGQGQNWGPQDLPLSPLANDCIHTAAETGVESTIWSPAYYDNQTDYHIDNSDTSYLLPGVPHIRGGLLRNYSRLVHLDSCPTFGYDMIPAVNFSPEDVLIITRGLCGSTCALFANHMALYDDVKTVVVGGLPNQDQMQYTSFPGLQVLDNGPLFSMFKQLGKDISTADPATTKYDPVPRLLPTQAAFRFCVREIYPPTAAYGTNPMEYTFQPATYHMLNDELIATYPMYTWYSVLDYFP